MLGFEPPTSGDRGRNLPQDHLGKWDWMVLKFVLNKACPIICNLTDGSEFGQFGKTSIGTYRFINITKQITYANNYAVLLLQ